MKTFKENGYTLKAYRARYTNNRAPYIALYDERDEPYVDVTVNLDCCNEKIVAVDRKFKELCSPELVKEVISEYFGPKLTTVASGFCQYDIHAINETTFNELPELE